jgi:hypothetical protein
MEDNVLAVVDEGATAADGHQIFDDFPQGRRGRVSE